MEGCETFNELQIEDRANKIIDQFDFWVEEIYPREINLSSVYDLEAQNYITCFSHVKSKIDIVYAENFDFSYEDLVSRLSKFTKEPIDFSSWLIDRNTHKKCSVSKAAYILAKFYFNCHIQDLHEKYGDIGTGYLGDKKTENYIVNSLRSGEQNPIIRHSYFELEKLRETIDY
jgi:ribonuclease HII